MAITHFLSLRKYSASLIIRTSWATFFQNLGRIKKVSIIKYAPSITYTLLKNLKNKKVSIIKYAPSITYTLLKNLKNKKSIYH